MKVYSAFILFTSLLFSLVASAQPVGKGKVNGKVSDQKGAPIPFATVISDSLNIAVMTDEAGKFKIERIPFGNYNIRIQSVGFISVTKAISVTDTSTIYIEINLSENEESLKEVVVHGKTEVQKVKESGFNVNVIETKEAANKSSDINQILNTTTGVRIREEGGLGSGFDFSLNGFNGNQVRFFLDGIPMENFGSSLTLNNIPVNVAQRIEVYKGVVPVWLGSDALGGAINIVTDQSGRNYLDASYSYGSFNTHRSSINGSYRFKKTGLTFRANIFQNYSDNSYKVEVNKIVGTKIYNEMVEVKRFHDAYDSKTAIIDLGVTDKKYADQLFAGIVMSGFYKEIQTGSTMEKVYGSRYQKGSTLMPTLKYKKKDLFIKGLELNTYASYNFGYAQTVDTASRLYDWYGNYKENGIDPNGGEYELSKYKYTDNASLLNSNLSYLLTKNHSLVVNYTMNGLNRKGSDETNPNSVSNKEPKQLNKSIIGIGYKFDWNDRIAASVFYKQYLVRGTTHYTDNIYTTKRRIERKLNQNYSGYGTAISYRVLRPLQLKASFEKAYRMPEGSELFGDGANVKENPYLLPEESQNYNIGFQYKTKIKASHFITLEGSYLYRNAKNFIRQTIEGPQSKSINDDAVTVSGVEGSLEYIWKNLWRFSTNLTYQKVLSNDKYNEFGRENLTYRKQLTNIPYLFGNVRTGINLNKVLYDHDRASLEYEINFVEEYYLKWEMYGSRDDKYTIPRQQSHSIFLNYSLKNGRYNISAECRNLFDAKLYDKFRLQKPGRAFFIKLRYFIKQ